MCRFLVCTAPCGHKCAEVSDPCSRAFSFHFGPLFSERLVCGRSESNVVVGLLQPDTLYQALQGDTANYEAGFMNGCIEGELPADRAKCWVCASTPLACMQQTSDLVTRRDIYNVWQTIMDRLDSFQSRYQEIGKTYFLSVSIPSQQDHDLWSGVNWLPWDLFRKDTLRPQSENTAFIYFRTAEECATAARRFAALDQFEEARAKLAEAASQLTEINENLDKLEKDVLLLRLHTAYELNSTRSKPWDFPVWFKVEGYKPQEDGTVRMETFESREDAIVRMRARWNWILTLPETEKALAAGLTRTDILMSFCQWEGLKESFAEYIGHGHVVDDGELES